MMSGCPQLDDPLELQLCQDRAVHRCGVRDWGGARWVCVSIGPMVDEAVPEGVKPVGPFMLATAEKGNRSRWW